MSLSPTRGARLPIRVGGKALGLVVAMTLFGAAPTAAAPPAAATGSGEITSSVFTEVRTAGGNTIAQFVNAGTVQGALVGDFVEHGQIVFHNSGAFTFTASAVITGSTESCGAAVIPLRISGQGQGTLPNATASGKIVTTNGGSGVVAVLSFTQSGTTFTYMGRIRCTVKAKAP
jgi:hypothetical protein